MTHERRRHVGGKGFSPTMVNADKTTAMTTQGSGKQFAPTAVDPATVARIRQTRGSGKQFAPTVKDPATDVQARQTIGSGKQFAAGAHASGDEDIEATDDGRTAGTDGSP
jgi:hypothetical protein